MLERLALERPVAERHLAADRGGRGQRHDLGHREPALGEDRQHLAADIAGCPGDRDLEA